MLVISVIVTVIAFLIFFIAAFLESNKYVNNIPEKYATYIIVTGIIGIMVSLVLFSIDQILADRKFYTYTFDVYKKRYPDLVKDGKVKCIKCGGTSIWMKQYAANMYAHTCHNCGTELYYSKS